MHINGIELDFHLYDDDKAGIKNRYFEGLDKMNGVKDEMPDGTEQEKNKYLCDQIKGLFDSVFGEGTGAAVCGTDNDRLAHLDAYEQLVAEQVRQKERDAKIMNRLKGMSGAASK